MGGFDYHVIPSEYIGVDGLAGPSSCVRQHQSGMVERPGSAYQRPALVSAFDGAGERDTEQASMGCCLAPFYLVSFFWSIFVSLTDR